MKFGTVIDIQMYLMSNWPFLDLSNTMTDIRIVHNTLQIKGTIFSAILGFIPVGKF